MGGGLHLHINYIIILQSDKFQSLNENINLLYKTTSWAEQGQKD